jgi:hypothetical protein
MSALDYSPSRADLALINGVADALSPQTDPMAHDPVGWIRSKGAFVWSKQAEICEAVRDYRFTAVRSCHGSGKSFIAAWIAAWWMDTHEDAVVVTSAPSSNQVKNILWKEIRRAHVKAGLRGHITHSEVPEWKINGEVVAFGRKPADYVDPDEARTRFQGIHAAHVLVILDEGSGIPEWLAGAAEDLAVNEQSRILLIGNPTNPTSYFAKVSQPASLYHRIRISAWDLPAYTGEYVPPEVEAVLTGKLWVEERRKAWGEGSLYWVAKIEAEFPQVAEDVLFTPAIITRAINADLSHLAITGPAKASGGMDVARMGDDETVIYINKRGYVRLKDRWGKLDLEETVARYMTLWPISNPGASPTMNIDVTGGLGHGPYDRLKKLGYPVVEINFGAKAVREPDRFKNRRAEMYYTAMEACRDGRVDMDDLDEELQRELMEHRFKPVGTGLIQLEPKEEVARRLGRSPDRADAFVMSLQRSVDWAAALNVKTADTAVNPDRAPSEPSAEELVRDLMDVKL